MKTSGFSLLSVQIGQPESLVFHGKAFITAFRKKVVTGRIAVHPLGLEGDSQANLTVHGGLSKAIYAYPSEHYPYWNAQRKALGHLEPLGPGGLGENLTITGLLETDVYVGDELHFPQCVLRIKEPRQPCSKFTAILGDKQAAKKMAKTGFCGFYLAVHAPGTISAEETFHLKPGKREVSISDLFRIAMDKS